MPQPVSELNKYVWARLGPSAIHGIGVIAIRDIPAGTLIDGGMAVYDPEGWDAVLPEIQGLMLDRHPLDDPREPDTLMTNPNTDADLQTFMNYSSTPNSDGHRTLVDIKKGEEITEDYTKFDLPLPQTTLDYYKHFSL